jgi:thioredoxin-related protein
MPLRLLATVALCLSAVFSGCDNSKPKKADAAVPKTEVASERVSWLTDLDEGIKVAKAEKKAILVDFTGSDWCGWCIRLKKEVFDQKEFAAATKDFVLVELDYPQKKQQSAEVKAKNKVWAEKFSIEGFPTIMLLDSNGEPFAQTGYEAGGPVKYLAHLADLMKSNTAEGKAKLAQGKKDEILVRGYGEALEALITPHLEKKDLAAAEAAIAKFIKDKAVTGAAKVTLSVNARVGSVQACKPGDHAAVLKVLDEVIADNPADLTGELKQFRAQVAAAQAADKDKK